MGYLFDHTVFENTFDDFSLKKYGNKQDKYNFRNGSKNGKMTLHRILKNFYAKPFFRENQSALIQLHCQLHCPHRQSTTN